MLDWSMVLHWAVCRSAEVMPAVFLVMSYVFAFCIPTCLWLLANEDQINSVYTVHMVPIERLPSTRASIVLCLCGLHDSDVAGLDFAKLDFQMKCHWCTRLYSAKIFSFDYTKQGGVGFYYKYSYHNCINKWFKNVMANFLEYSSGETRLYKPCCLFFTVFFFLNSKSRINLRLWGLELKHLPPCLWWGEYTAHFL